TSQRSVTRKDDLKLPVRTDTAQARNHSEERRLRPSHLIGHTEAGDSHRSERFPGDEQHVVRQRYGKCDRELLVIIGRRKRHSTGTRELDRDVLETVFAGNPAKISVEQSRLMCRIVAVSKRRKMLFRQQRPKTDQAALIRSTQQNPAAGFCDPRELPAESTG